MRATLDVLRKDACLLENFSSDSRLSSQAAHQVDLDIKHLGRLGRNLPPQLLKDHGACFNKQRRVWEVPAFSNLFPFMPYISEGTRMTTVDCVFSKLEARVQARLEIDGMFSGVYGITWEGTRTGDAGVAFTESSTRV